MSGCATTLDRRSLLMVYEDGINVMEYNSWIQNYKNVYQSILLDERDPSSADWTHTTFYMKEAGSTVLSPVIFNRETVANKHHVWWTRWNQAAGRVEPYLDETGQPLRFEFDPYEGVKAYLLTIVDLNELDGVTFNGSLLFDDRAFDRNNQPIPLWKLNRKTWAWIDEHTLHDGDRDVVVTPFGEDTKIDNPIAQRFIAIRESEHARNDA